MLKKEWIKQGFIDGEISLKEFKEGFKKRL